MLILAYADWCGHCQAFKPVWNEFKAKYGKVIDIRELNADKDKNIIQHMQIKGFPTIILLKDGIKHEFNGQRDMKSLEQFVKEELNPHVNENLKNYRSK